MVVEKDERFLPALHQLASLSKGRLIVIHGDILTIPHQQIIDHYHPTNVITPSVDASEPQPETYTKAHFVGNLPFGISTILIIRWMELLNSKQGIFSLKNIQMTLMFQKEVGNGICATQHQYLRSRLSLMTQSFCRISEELVLGPESFVPAPKVSASVLKFVPRDDDILGNVPFHVFEKVVKYCFSAKNKLLLNSLG